MDLDDVTKKCYYCKRRDFLPFTCPFCSQEFCLEHKDTQEHYCKTPLSYRKIEHCKLCGEQIQYLSDQNFDEILKTHKCKGKKVNKSVDKCPVCKINLTCINRHLCLACNKVVCLKHRFPPDHCCAGKTEQQDDGWKCSVM